jgi:putative FmdB family regulatory protein
MPLYEYLCGACGHRFEQIRKFSDSPLEVCPNCGERKLHKLVSSPAIQFKGSGWYINDYAKKSPTDPSKKDTADPSAPAPAAKSDDKTASKSSESSESGTAAKSSTSADTVSASSTAATKK